MNQTILKLITGSNKYASRGESISLKLAETNKLLVEELKMLGIKQLNITTLGNSIASGYSMIDTIKPLLLRNETLLPLLKENYIEANLYNFSRAQDNNDEHLLKWINNNVKQSELNKRNQIDLNGGDNSMLCDGITKEEVLEYFPLNLKKDKGLQDIILENDVNQANIIVYAGCTGSFMDNFTRQGVHKNLSGFDRDLISLESILKTIYFKNCYTQVYVCGIQDLLNIGIVNIINKKIKKICDNYSNATYVSPAPANLLYNVNGELKMDIHHSKIEYLMLNNNIISSIANNYLRKMFLTDLNCSLTELSDIIQYEHPEFRNNNQLLEERIATIVSKYKPLFLKQGKDFNIVLKDFIKYYKERYPHDYFYTPKEETIDIIKGQK